jgi:hypothetical protein
MRHPDLYRGSCQRLASRRFSSDFSGEDFEEVQPVSGVGLYAMGINWILNDDNNVILTVSHALL